MHESLQAGLASRAKSHVILQDNELAIRHFHEGSAGLHRRRPPLAGTRKAQP